jgi:hypothetical protein
MISSRASSSHDAAVNASSDEGANIVVVVVVVVVVICSHLSGLEAEAGQTGASRGSTNLSSAVAKGLSLGSSVSGPCSCSWSTMGWSEAASQPAFLDTPRRGCSLSLAWRRRYSCCEKAVWVQFLPRLFFSYYAASCSIRGFEIQSRVRYVEGTRLTRTEKNDQYVNSHERTPVFEKL